MPFIYLSTFHMLLVFPHMTPPPWIKHQLKVGHHVHKGGEGGILSIVVSTSLQIVDLNFWKHGGSIRGVWDMSSNTNTWVHKLQVSF
jgi:hypothetical protein